MLFCSEYDRNIFTDLSKKICFKTLLKKKKKNPRTLDHTIFEFFDTCLRVVDYITKIKRYFLDYH